MALGDAGGGGVALGVLPGVPLTPGEQRVLIRAMLTESDAQIAVHLGVSLDSVKKTWRRVFERAAHAAPELFASVGGTGKRNSGQSRGLEKRRHLLDHLRSHLEELRPHEK